MCDPLRNKASMQVNNGSPLLDAPTPHREFNVTGAVVALCILLLAVGVWEFLSKEIHNSHKRIHIKVIEQEQPLRPPPPIKIEKKLEAPKEQKEIKVEQPKEVPPSNELKMEGAAGNGPSAFGTGRITNEDLSKIGKIDQPENVGGGKAKFNPYDNYANLLKGDMQRYLRKHRELRESDYTVEVQIWVAAGGALQKFELVGSTGVTATDEAIKQALASLPGFEQAPPTNMPQPIRLRINTED
jgi:protein TonB